jgi:hypothetical protein
MAIHLPSLHYHAQDAGPHPDVALDLVLLLFSESHFHSHIFQVRSEFHVPMFPFLLPSLKT